MAGLGRGNRSYLVTKRGVKQRTSGTPRQCVFAGSHDTPAHLLEPYRAGGDPAIWIVCRKRFDPSLAGGNPEKGHKGEVESCKVFGCHLAEVGHTHNGICMRTAA